MLSSAQLPLSNNCIYCTYCLPSIVVWQLLEQVGRHALVAQVEGLGLDDLGLVLDGDGAGPAG